MSEQLEMNTGNAAMAADARGDEMHLLDLLTALARQKRLSVGVPLATGTLALLISLISTPIFTSTAVILPPQQQSSGAAAVLGQLGGLAGAAGGFGALKNPNDIYVGMLQSRTVADNLINRFKLKQRYERENMDDTRKYLERVSVIASGKNNLISISVEDKDPAFAADLANAYVIELATLTKTLAVTEAGQRRLFFERQLKAAKNDMADAEVTLRKMQEATGMIQLDGQVKGIIANAAQLQGTIAGKEVQLAAMRTYATSSNPDLLRLQEELRGLHVQLDKMQKGQAYGNGDLMVPSGKIPGIGVEYVRALRDVKYYETIFELIAKQYELAKIDEAKDSSSIQQLDKAVPADKKTKPKRAFMVLGGLFGGAVLGVFIALMRDAYTRSRQSKEGGQRWQDLSNAWKKRAN